MNANQQDTELAHPDGQLVDLVRAALVDPNIHTDTRMRLCEEITELLQAHSPSGVAVPQTKPTAPTAHYDQLLDVLESVLTDPNLHTDTRTRLHHEIREILK